MTFRHIYLLAALAGLPLAAAGYGAKPSDTAPAPAAFANCAACHTVKPNGSHGVGPNLWGLAGRKAGTAPGFNYSNALRSSGIYWTRAEVDVYLRSPSKRVPGTTMHYAGLSDPKAREGVIRYLFKLN